MNWVEETELLLAGLAFWTAFELQKEGSSGTCSASVAGLVGMG